MSLFMGPRDHSSVRSTLFLDIFYCINIEISNSTFSCFLHLALIMCFGVKKNNNILLVFFLAKILNLTKFVADVIISAAQNLTFHDRFGCFLITLFDVGYFWAPQSELCCHCSDDYETWHRYQA